MTTTNSLMAQHLGYYVLFYINYAGENKEVYANKKEASARFDELAASNEVSFIEITQTICNRRYTKPMAHAE